MGDLYLDTSVLVSLYTTERYSDKNTAAIRTYLGRLLVSDLAHVEFYSAIAMKQRTGGLSQSEKEAVLHLFQTHIDQKIYSPLELDHTIYLIAKQFLSDSKVILNLCQCFGIVLKFKFTPL